MVDSIPHDLIQMHVDKSPCRLRSDETMLYCVVSETLQVPVLCQILHVT